MMWAICGVRIRSLVWRCWASEGGQSLELHGSSVEGGGVPRNQRKVEKQDDAVLKYSQEKLCRWEKQANNGTFS